MEANNTKSIGNWLAHIDDGSLCLPRFQREQVWSKQEICKFFETLILNSETPVGVFLVLPTDPSNPAFPPRTIDGPISRSGTCNSLLLDGQQRLSALWKVLHDEDEEFRYYIQFNDQFEIEHVKAIRKNTKASQRLNQNPTREYKRHWFPAKLLNPLVDREEVDTWLNKLELEKLKLSNHNSVKDLIMNTRKIFDRKKKGGKVVPYFQLSAGTSRDTAVNIYKIINTNLIKLSYHYLAVAEMEKKTHKSLYDVADELVGKVPSIEDLETDEIGELILKISCVLQNKKSSGGNYKHLDFNKVLSDERLIFSGIAWAVEKLAKLGIWHGGQLPSVVPLRVLPALHQYEPKSKQGQKRADANKVITKYLWYSFLTDRYDRQANDRLKEDYEDLRDYLEGKKKENQIRIFHESKSPSLDDIKIAGWPQSTRRLARGILLVCCQEGANTLASNEELTTGNYKDREKHHIFPKSKLSNAIGHSGDYALNCLLIPRDDNQRYQDELPGDYIEKLSQDLGVSLPQLDVVDRLETHLISRNVANDLVQVTQDSIDNGQIVLKNAYNDFIESRAFEVEASIKRLLSLRG